MVTQKLGGKMKNKKFGLGILALMLVFGIMLSGCSINLGHSNFYSDTVKVGEKRGQASNTSLFGVIGDGYPKVEKVAKKNDITKIGTVEHYFEIGFLGLWVTYTTIVTGE
jgi:hypothetical protein